MTQALLPWFVLPWRWDAVDVIGRALEMAANKVGVRRIAVAVGRPETTVREWVRRFRVIAETLAAAILALAVSWGWSSWELPTATQSRCLAAVKAIGDEWRRRYGAGRPWRITNLITGGRMLPSNIASLLAASTAWSWMTSKSIEEVPNGP
ncbi:MAG TPA: helix-turn-helix domain-containing protein [Chloroflexota bacterium]|nr:helix-turn-helix domain-containing protein [Chloroflexota bacterium]